MVTKNTLVAEGVGAIVNEFARSGIGRIRAVPGGVVTKSILDKFARHTVVEVGDFFVGVHVSRETYRRRRCIVLGVGNEPEAADDTSRPSNGSLHDIRVGDLRYSTTSNIE